MTAVFEATLVDRGIRTEQGNSSVRCHTLTERNVLSAYSGYFSKNLANNSRLAVESPGP